MILKELTSSLPNFKSIKFKAGINIIIGSRSDEETNDESFNGVGKSLVGRIINYCLSSDDNSFENAFNTNEFKESISFTLSFTANNNESYIIERTVNAEKKNESISINDEYYPKKKFSVFLQELLFNKEAPAFRSLVHYFFRNQKQYESYILKSKNSYTDLIAILYLINIDLNYMYKKQELVVKISNLRKTLTYLKSKLKGENNKQSIKNTEAEVTILEKQLKQFNVADGYEKEVLKLQNNEKDHKELLEELDKFKYIKEQAQKFLDSLRLDTMPNDYIDKMYKEINFFLPDNIKKEIELVEEFHRNIYKNREKRLKSNIINATNNISNINEKIDACKININELTALIDKNGIMEEYFTITNKLYATKNKLTKLNDNRTEIENTNIQITEKNKDLDVLMETLKEYYYTINPDIEKIWENPFREHLNQIYGQPDGSIELKTNIVKTTKTAFDIEVKANHDGSDGRQQVAIFVFDWLLLLYGQHHLNCLYHDNRLYQAIDSTIAVKMMKLSEKLCNKKNQQYIICIDQDKYEAMIEHDPEMEIWIKKRTILKLKDSADKNGKDKLLGMNINIQQKE